MRKIASVAVFAALLFSCVSSFAIPVSAAELSDDDAFLYFDGLSELKSHYNLSGTIDIESDVCYIYGRRDGGSGDPRGVLWIDNKGYRFDYKESASVPYYEFYTTTDCSVAYLDSMVGHGNIGYFFYSTDTGVLLLAGQTTNLIGYNKMSSYTSATSLSYAETLDEFIADAEPTEPTEPTETDAPPFTLPNEWINGGETLPDATEITYPDGFDPDDAFEQFQDVTLEVSDDVQGGIGFFWEVLIRYINALSLMPLVFFSLVFVLITWFLKG